MDISAIEKKLDSSSYSNRDEVSLVLFSALFAQRYHFEKINFPSYDLSSIHISILFIPFIYN